MTGRLALKMLTAVIHSTYSTNNYVNLSISMHAIKLAKT